MFWKQTRPCCQIVAGKSCLGLLLGGSQAERRPTEAPGQDVAVSVNWGPFFGYPQIKSPAISPLVLDTPC